MKTVKIALIGFGTVGSGLYQLMSQNGKMISLRTGIDCRLELICDLRAEHVKSLVSDVKVITDWKEAVCGDNIDIVVELIGGIEPAKSIIASALEAGKNVVTANKKLLAEEGAQLFSLAGHKGLSLGFEASVGGGIPCILALSQGLAGNNIHSVMGILNGTCNYILSGMENSGMSFEDALKIAQKKGFAEADPTFDLEGYDAGHKISLLAMLAYGKSIDCKAVSIEGISNIKSMDISSAGDMGYSIKLLGIAKCVDGFTDIRVHPTMIALSHPLASVRDEFNAIMFDGDMTGPVMLNGRGAGGLATASALLSDIVQISSGAGYRMPSCREAAKFLDPEKRVSRYYIRMQTDDSPGILSKISGVLGAHDISIASVIQKETHDARVPVIFTTHEARETGMLAAVSEIKRFDFVHGDVMMIRMEDGLN